MDLFIYIFKENEMYINFYLGTKREKRGWVVVKLYLREKGDQKIQ